MFRYQLRGRSLTIPGRIIRMTVTAGSADDARRVAALRNPDFGPTIKSPKRRSAVVELDDDTCWHEVVIDQERIDGIWFGHCPACHESVAATGDENEAGEPGWEVTESMHVSMPFHGHSVSVEVVS